MDSFNSIHRLVEQLDQAGLRYALIGGLAMAMRGVQRATFDIDFLLMSEDLEKVSKLLEENGYTCVHRSQNVSHFERPTGPFARVDILHAFRSPSLAMLARADRLPLGQAGTIPVLQITDIIGLKIQAAVNDPARQWGDWNDIYWLVSHAAETGAPLDWTRLEGYLELFGKRDKLVELKELYGRQHRE